MSSEAEIANLSGVLIGDETGIVSLDDNKTLPRTLKTVWDTERRATLRDGSWNFAAKRAQLAASADIEPFPFQSAFPLPADCLRLIEVLDPYQMFASTGISYIPDNYVSASATRYASIRDTYQVEAGAVLADTAGPLFIRYVFDVPEVAVWDELAANAFAHRLAAKCGKRIAGSAFDTQMAWQAYGAALGRAKHVDAGENPPIVQEDGSWISARRGFWRA
jgi:hypothetical protein